MLLAIMYGLTRCGDSAPTQLLVLVSAVPSEGLPIEVVEVEVQSEDSLTTWDSARFTLVGAPGGRFTLPLTFGVAPRSALTARVRVTARARLREGTATRPLVTSALTNFVADQRLLLPLVFDYRCSLHPPCAPGLSCNTQSCVSELRPAETLRPMGPDEESPTTGSTCARPAEACSDRCGEGSSVPVARFINRRGQSALSANPEASPCCGDHTLTAREVFRVAASPRPDLLPLFICRSTGGQVLYSLLESCELFEFNDGILGYVLPPISLNRCGSVPLYRLYHPGTFDHFYTVDVAERDRLHQSGYVLEGTHCNVWPASSTR